MKIAGVSTSSIQNGMNFYIKRAQNDLLTLQKEFTSGQIEDFGVKLGVKTGDVLELNQENQRIERILEANNLVQMRLSLSQNALDNVDKIYQDILEKTPLLFNSMSSQYTIDDTVNLIRDSFVSFTSCINITADGSYLFSGINSSVQPFQDYFAKDSLAKKSFDQMLEDFLKENSKGLPFGQDLSVSSMSDQQMTEFIGKLESSFLNDDYWAQNWSKASSQNVKNNINDTEVRDISINTNASGIRNFALFSVIGIELLKKDLQPQARDVLNKKMISCIGKGLEDITKSRATLGYTEARLKKSNTVLTDQKNIMESYLVKLIGVDQEKNSFAIQELLNRIDLSYAITSKIWKLSLLNYL
ncbi:flagellar hook-associated family protein [Candidatus Liberibacter sp.]|uniref:flagellar hook-associated family protein n=1 Tax=Candidatus Liberibacter sp. TaxID=34022 RepID=UPI0015F36B2A|nr:flagellar hook-associated family protein [Candidatus Liberibacter sp.]MBA5723547.1 flagellar hook-associated family protein [Candidatus Liberibacter sp.]